MKKRTYLLFLLLFLFLQHSVGQKRVNYDLIMRNTGTDTMWDGASFKVYGFTQKLAENVPIPAVTLYANEGDTLVIKVRNISQGDPHTIHPHGMDVNQENDGTPMTSFVVDHNETATYTIPCTHAGTFIYHCHMADVVHVQMGMYGLIVVHAKNGEKTAWTNGPAFDSEYSWLTSEFDKQWHDSVPMNPNHDSISHENFYIPAYIPDYFLVNGKSRQELQDLKINAKVGEKVYLRLANIGFYMNEVIIPPWLDPTWIDSDGRPLKSSFKSDSFRIAPGERYGVMLTATKEYLSDIAIRYINMNTYKIWDTEFIPVEVKGSVGIEKIQPSIFVVYPNPADNKIFIHSNSPGKQIEVEIINSLGEVVHPKTMIKSNQSIDISLLPKGLYFAKLNSGNSFECKTFIVE